MAGSEREKWNAIYGEHDRAPGTPARVLTDYAHLLPAGGRALDLACGKGQNALFLAARGLDTCAWDISAVALQQLNERAQQLGLQVHVEERDAVARPPEPDSFDVIVVCRFLDRSLAPQLSAALRSGGLLCYQTFTREAAADAGPRNPLYRLGPNELLKLFAGLHVIAYHEEGTVGDAHTGFRDEALLVAQRQEGLIVDRRRLEELLARGPDNALLRVSLGSVCIQEGQTAEALAHLTRALQLDPEYSAAWKMYARCLNAAGRRDEAIEAYRSGIRVAEKRGDMQALREMTVFLKRLEGG